MDYAFLHSLLNELERYQAEGGRDSLASFAVWLSEKHGVTNALERPDSFFNSMDEELAYSITTLYKHAGHYIKTALRNSPLNGPNDFAYLATLLQRGDLRKSELIAENFTEFSSGMEVIRRLLRHGLIEDYDDPEDRRSRRVRLTDQGREVFQESLATMQQASRLIGGNLSAEEKSRLLALLNKLMHFHEPIWREDLGEPLENILEKYPPARP